MTMLKVTVSASIKSLYSQQLEVLELTSPYVDTGVWIKGDYTTDGCGRGIHRSSSVAGIWVC